LLAWLLSPRKSVAWSIWSIGPLLKVPITPTAAPPEKSMLQPTI
jgi:hypothetical protein